MVPISLLLTFMNDIVLKYDELNLIKTVFL